MKRKVSARLTIALSALVFALLPVFPAHAAQDVSTVDFSAANGVYTGAPVETVITSALTENVDYTLSYENNILPGTASVIITGKGNYSGTKTLPFTISDDPSITAEVRINPVTPVYYTGKAQTPDLHVFSSSGVELIRNSQYTVVYYDNTSAGNAVYTVHVGNKVKSGTFMILQKQITEENCAAIPAQEYTGMAVTPALTISADGRTLVPDTDYTAVYMNNVNVGTNAIVKVDLKGNYIGSFTKTFAIAKKVNPYIVQASVGDDISSFSYMGEMLYEGTDYDVTVSEGKTVLVFKGVWMGTATIDYTPKGTVTFITGVDDWEVKPQTGTVDLTKILPTMRAGVSFIGWYDNPGYTGKPLTTVTGDATVYARWEDDTKTCVPGDHLRLRISPKGATILGIEWTVDNMLIGNAKELIVPETVRPGDVIRVAVTGKDKTAYASILVAAVR